MTLPRWHLGSRLAATGTCLVCLALAGCGPIDPYERDGAWRPASANDGNLRAMVAVPSDLARGRSDLRGDGQLADAALERLRGDKVRAFADTAVAKALPSGATDGGK